MNIISATYGSKGHHVNVNIPKDMDFIVCNEVLGIDPNRGMIKYLKITFDNGSSIYFAEGCHVKTNMLTLFPKVQSQEHPFVTFIIPSIGRPTLVNALRSLMNNNNPLWCAIVVFDGIDIPLPILNSKIISKPIKKIGFKNCAGRVRNLGIKDVKTDWVAFLDDDDQVTPDYVERLEYEISNHSNADVILFRMLHHSDTVMPPSKSIILHKTGISFAIKKSVALNYPFQSCTYEDFALLIRLQQSGRPIYVSDFLTYIVR